MPVEFVHTHVHSDNSILDASTSVDLLAERAAKNGMKAIALTDHGNVFGHVEFYKACKKQNVKPILGCEFYVARTSAAEPLQRFGEGFNPTDHLVVLAENNEGYRNLLKLATMAYVDGFHHTPRIDLGMLEKHSKGLIAQTACLSGGVNRLLIGWKARNPATKTVEEIPADFGKAKDLALRLNNIFGPGNFFLEVQNHVGPYQDDDLVERQQRLFNQVLELHRVTGIPMIGTNDIHFADPDGARAREMAMVIARNREKTIEAKNDRANHAGEFYFKSSDQMDKVFQGYDFLLKNTLLVAERCNVSLEIGQRRFAQPVVNGKRLTDEEVQKLWTDLLNQGMEKFGFRGKPEYETRLAYEKQVIEKMGFPPYFIIIWDFIRHAISKGIPVGPSRGSGGGCLCVFLLDITQTDPIKYGLLFERFLNPGRVSMPDLDIDFADERIPEVMQYLCDNYGKDRVSRIATFGSFWARGAIRNVGKQLGLPLEDIEDLANSIPESQGEFRVTLEDAINDVPKIRDLVNNPDPVKKDLLSICRGIEGIKSNVSTHACGVVISDRPINDYMAMMVRKDEDATILQTQADMHAVEDLGLLKVDTLGLKTLTVIEIACNLIKKTGKTVQLRGMPPEDPEIFKMISEGRTNGLFQIESNGMREVVLRIRPQNIDELSDTIALFRPGPNDAKDEHGLTMVDHYILRKFGREPVVYPDPCLEEVLKPTYGVIVYQEQIIKCVVKLCGYNESKGDELRRVIGKKKLKDIEAEKEKFIPSAMAHSKVSKEKAEEIWSTIETFARYGFNRSHSLGYAFLTYWTAYLKRYYPVEFMCGLLTKATRGGRDEEDIARYIDECYRLGIPVYSPDVNKSEVGFVPEGNGIRAGLTLIKKVNKAAAKIVGARSLGGNTFLNFKDMIEKLVAMKVTKTAIDPLVASGACDSMGDRATLIGSVVSTLAEVRKNKEKGATEIEEMEEEELTAETLDRLNCYSIPAYPVTRLGLVCPKESLEGILKVLKVNQGSIPVAIRVLGDECSIDLKGITCGSNPELPCALLKSGASSVYTR